MNVFFSADWETASDTERGNEGGRKGEIYAVPTDRGRNGRGENGRTDKRGLNSVAARFMSRSVDLGGKDDTDDDAFPAG